MFKIDSKEKIEGLLSFYSREEEKERINKILSSYPNINSTEAFILNMYTIAFCLENSISKANYNDIFINIYESNDKDIKNENALGSYSGKINDKHLINLYPLNEKVLMGSNIKHFVQALVTFSHEIYHMQQQIDVDSKKFDYFTIVYCLEFLLKDKLPDFYKNNYGDLACEILAESYGVIMAKKFLQQINNKVDYSNFEDWILKSTRPNYKRFSSKEDKNYYLYNLIETALSNNVIDNDSLNKYPLLKRVFTGDGKLQSEEHFCSLQSKLKEKLELSDLPLFQKEEIMEGIESLIEVSKIKNGKKR